MILALLAGAVGMLSSTSATSAALAAVFISVATVLAAAFAVVAAAIGEWRTAAGSTLRPAVNLIGIVLGSVLVLVLCTRRYRADLGRPLAQG